MTSHPSLFDLDRVGEAGTGDGPGPLQAEPSPTPTGPAEPARREAAGAEGGADGSAGPGNRPNPEQDPGVRTTDPDTCVVPAEFKMSSGRLLALETHAAHAEGLTDFQLADLTGVQQQSIGKRRGELVKNGFIVATTLRRPAPSGAPATVYRITPTGVEFLRGES